MALVASLATTAVTLAWFFVAAKAHGRQIRLEREYVGIDHVDFRRETQNHPWVEALWRQDRRGYWSLAGALFVTWCIVLLPFPAFERWLIVPFAAIFAMATAFTIQGHLSKQRLMKRIRSGEMEPVGPTPRHADGDWLAAAKRGTTIWLGTSFALMFLSNLVLVISFVT